MKNKTLLFCLTLSIFFFSASYEKEGESPVSSLGTIMVSEGFFVSPTLKESYKSDMVNEVFNRLKMAKGDFRTKKPELHFMKQIPDGGKIAMANSELGEVYFEEGAYDVCASLGRDSLDALAALLGHELTHCYENHSWEDKFKSEFRATQMDKKLHDHYMDDEIQADYLGGFLSYSAGYQPFGIMSKFIPKLYEEYDLSDESLEGSYPTMKERIEISVRSEEKLRSLIDYFEMANYLVLMDQFEDAQNYLNAIEGEFQSREIYNNIGVVATLDALDYFAPTVLKYNLPIVLDAETRMGSRGSSEKEKREELILTALSYFDKAKSMDNSYPLAYLNEGCAYLLQGLSTKDDFSYDEAEIAAKKAIRVAKKAVKKEKDTTVEIWKKTIVDSYILLGIIEAIRENPDSASALFNRALKKDKNSLLAKTNKNILEGNPPTTRITNNNLAFAVLDEKIDGVRIVEMSVQPEAIKKDLALPEGTIFAVVEQENSRLLVNYVPGDKKRNVSVLQTGPNYSNTTNEGIKIGDSYDEVILKYPNPGDPLELGKGFFLKYKTPAIIFQFDDENKVQRWAVYN